MYIVDFIDEFDFNLDLFFSLGQFDKYFIFLDQATREKVVSGALSSFFAKISEIAKKASSRSDNYIHWFIIKNLENIDEVDALLSYSNKLMESISKCDGIDYRFNFFGIYRMRRDLLSDLKLAGFRDSFLFLDIRKDGTAYSLYQWLYDIFSYFSLLATNEENIKVPRQDLLPQGIRTFCVDSIMSSYLSPKFKNVLNSLLSYLKEKQDRSKCDLDLDSFDALYEDLIKIYSEEFDKFCKSHQLWKKLNFPFPNKISDIDKLKKQLSEVNEKISDKSMWQDILLKFLDDVHKLYGKFLEDNSSRYDFLDYLKRSFNGNSSLKELSDALDKLEKTSKEDRLRSYNKSLKNNLQNDLELTSVLETISKLEQDFIDKQKLISRRSYSLSFILFGIFLLPLILSYLFNNHLMVAIFLVLSFLSFLTPLWFKRFIINKEEDGVLQNIINISEPIKNEFIDKFKKSCSQLLEFIVHPFGNNLKERYFVNLKLAKNWISEQKEFMKKIKENIERILEELKDIKTEDYDFKGNPSFVLNIDPKFLDEYLVFKDLVFREIFINFESRNHKFNKKESVRFTSDYFLKIKKFIPSFDDRYLDYSGSKFVILKPLNFEVACSDPYYEIESESDVILKSFYFVNLKGEE